MVQVVKSAGDGMASGSALRTVHDERPSWPLYGGARSSAVVGAISVERAFRCGYPWTRTFVTWRLRGKVDDLRGASVWLDEFALEGRKRVKYGGMWSVRLLKGGITEVCFRDPPEAFCASALALLKQGGGIGLSDLEVSFLIDTLQRAPVSSLLETDRRMARNAVYCSEAGRSIREYIAELVAYRASEAFYPWAEAQASKLIDRISKGGING